MTKNNVCQYCNEERFFTKLKLQKHMESCSQNAFKKDQSGENDSGKSSSDENEKESLSPEYTRLDHRKDEGEESRPNEDQDDEDDEA